MGTTRFTASGIGLDGHEGYVEAHIDIDDPLMPGRRWISWHGSEVADHFTGRYRAACECGWSGPEVDAATRWPDMADPRDGWLREAYHDEVMTAWDEHTDPLLAALDRTGRLDELATVWRKAEQELADEILEALRRGADWPEIASAIGKRLDWTRERFGHLEARVA